MEGEKSSGVEVGPPISIVRLVLMLTTVGQQYLFLQQHDIIPSTGVCHKCHQVILGSPIVKGNERFWNCKKCKAVTTTRFGMVLYKSKMKLKNWILLAFCFTERNKTKRWLPQSGAYNLNEMLDLFQWFYLQKIEGRNPFWRLLELIAESNDYENVNNAQVDEIPDVEGAAVGGDDDEEEAEEGEDYESDDEEIYWFDCPFCKNIWLREDLRDQHMMTCDQRV